MDTLLDAIEIFIPGDWGNEEYSQDAPNEVICIRGADIENVKCGIYQNIPIRYVSNTSFNKKTLESGDIIIEKSGGSPTQSTGRVCYISDELIDSKKNVVCSNFCAAFRMKSKWYYKYIYYYLHNIYSQGNFFNYEGKTSGIRNLLLETAFQAITLPDIITDVQKRTVKILDKIDQKINLNTRMNAELEAMAKQLYDYWFIQFDFPDENGKPYKSSGGKMIYNEKLKREIPEGWEVETLGSILSFSNGINYEKGIEGDKKYRIINVRNITSSTTFINKSDLDIITLPSSLAEKYLISEDDIIIARSGTPGSTRLIDKPNDIIYCGFIIKGTPRHKHSKYFLMHYLKQLEGTDATKTGGSILQNVSQDTLSSLLTVVPQDNKLQQFNRIIESLYSLLNCYQTQTNKLIHLRDSLLPMLMNGQVIVE